MNSTLLRRGSAILGAAAIAGLSTGNLTAHAQVPFTCVPVITGGGIAGTGSSFQGRLETALTADYTGFCGTSVAYSATGSGGGITAITHRTTNFAGTDVPYSDAQWAGIQAGLDTSTVPPTGPFGKPSHVETFPVALGGVGVATTEACAANQPVSGVIVGKIFAGVIKNWSAVTPACAGSTDTIIALHRSGNSGTTTAFKTYLTKKDPGDFAAGCVNTGVTPPTATCYKDASTTWPNAAGTVCPGANTNLNLVGCLTNTATYPHAIAYVDEADAASAGLSLLAIDNADGFLIDLIDTLGLGSTLDPIIEGVISPSLLGFAEPSGGQCTAAAEVHATPVTPAADWSQVDISDGPNGYADCTYTYILAFDTPVTAGNASVAQAPTIANYIAYVVGPGQALLPAGYDALPTEVQVAAEVSAAALAVPAGQGL